MKQLKLNKEQRKILLEMCEDLFPEVNEISFVDDNVISFMGANKEYHEFHWFELCMLELPKRIADNMNTVLPESTHYRIYESMSKRLLGIHAIYVNLQPKHPVDFLYQEYKKL